MDVAASRSKFSFLVFALFTIFIGSYYYINFFKHKGSILDLIYTITETSRVESFDPLDADKTQNLPVMRMLYSSPLQIDGRNKLISNVLESFNYDPTGHTITFRLRSGLVFEDGSPLEIADLALAITRMALSRPNFPVIKQIIGITEWAQTHDPLKSFPTGIVVEGNTISVRLNGPSRNPLFRFCLELFSIIPRKCIDVKTNKLSCEIPPSSGPFKITSLKQNSIEFSKRDTLPDFFEKIQYRSVVFIYSKLRDVCKMPIAENNIIAGSELDILDSCDNVSNNNMIHWMPESRFLVLRFNPENKIFQASSARRFFANQVRKYLRAKLPNAIIEKSLFTRVLPGYLGSDTFKESEVDLSNEFRDVEITLPNVGTFGSVAFNAIIETARNLQMKISLEREDSPTQIVDKFVRGQYPVIAGSSGFWAQDPEGDLAMWMTRNLHKSMTFVWQDKPLYDLLNNLESNLESNKFIETLRAINFHIYETAYISPIMHFRRFYISSKYHDHLYLPQAVTSPAPWQILLTTK